MNAIVTSASSDIGNAACQRWLGSGWKVFGTYRTDSTSVGELRARGAFLVNCDLLEASSIENACLQLKSLCPEWDVLVLAAGSQDPVASFLDSSFDEWQRSLNINLVSQLKLLRGLLHSRSTGARTPTVIFFAGGGTNSAVRNYSAYTVSKIALIKMCELLDAEILDTKFVIIGPGWVRTKIHESTLKAGQRAGENYQKTRSMLAGASHWTPMDKVIDCCEWAVHAPREVVSGRNFSVVYDAWDTEQLHQMLIHDPNMYKLRRFGNEALVTPAKTKVE